MDRLINEEITTREDVDTAGGDELLELPGFG